jgi:hypothetical protein
MLGSMQQCNTVIRACLFIGGLERNTTSTTNNHHASYVPHRIGTPTVHAALAGLALSSRVPGGTGNAETAAIEKKR